MSANDRPSTSAPQDPIGEDMPKAAGISGLFQMIFASLQSSSSPNPANSFVKFSESTTIDLVKNELSKILDDYARLPARSKNIEVKGKMNKAIIKLFNKPIDNRSLDETTYFQSVRTLADGKIYPEAATVFEKILSVETPRDHPNGISGFAFAFISILSLSLNRSDSDQVSESLNRNCTSPYFDLSPLYGSNDRETDTVRNKDGSGMLWPDCFFEDRLATLPDATLALLILWNRFHNHTAKYLLWHDEKGNDKWKDLSELVEGSQELFSQDDQIFCLARSITCINFMNIIKEDILKGFFGLPLVGPSVEVDILHDVRGLVNETRIGHCSTMEAYFLYDFTSFTPPSIVDKSSDTTSVGNKDLRRRTYMGLHRNRNGYFDDGDLADVLFNAIDASAGAPGAQSIYERNRERVIRKIKQGQKWNVCTLNEFRESLGLKRLKSFSEWNSNIVVMREAEELYKNIDQLELYPGLLAEEPTVDPGFRFGRTMTWGLIVDTVTRIRSDPRFTAKFKEEELTKWGYHDCTTTLSQDPFNTVMPKLLHPTLPHNFPYKNAYSLYPFTVPTPESKERMNKQAELKRANLDFSRTKKKVKVLHTIEAISEVFNDPDRFPSPYKQSFCELTGGYGNMLGFDNLALHDRDLMSTLFALFPDEGAAKRIGATFGEKAQGYLRDRCTLLSGNKRARIDIVEDIIDATCVSWVCETIYDQDLYPNQKDKKRLSDEGIKKYTKEKEIEARDDFAACYAYIFRNGEPEIGLKIRERALDASEILQAHLEQKLDHLKRDKGHTHFGQYLMHFSRWLKEFIGQLLQEYSDTGKILPQTSAQTFLDRIMKAADLKPLKHIVDRTPHLLELKEKYKNGDSKQEQEARERLEKQRVIANVIALSVVISVHFAKVCAQAVDFYLNEKYASERNRLIELCTSKKSTNEEIMGYIREAQRIGQRFGLWRDVNLPTTEPQVVQQGHGHPDVVIEQGDYVFADFSSAHNDSKQFEEPEKVKPDREIISLQGLGIHKCPAGAFIDETMAEMFRVIFSQGNLVRASKNGQLRTTTLHPHASPWDSEVFLDDREEGYSFYPRKLMLEFDADEKLTSKERWEFTDDGVFLYLNRTFTIVTIITIVIIIIVNVIVLAIFIKHILIPVTTGFITSLLSYQTLYPMQLDSECRNMKEIRPYTINSFRPKWFGLFGEPTITYHTPIGRRSHKVTIVAIDKRDIQMRFWVDEKERGIVLTDLDPNIDCGEDIVKCLDLGFSAAIIDIPPGRHTFKAELIQQGNETSIWGDRRRRRVKMKVDQCL